MLSYNTTAEEILELSPGGVMLTDGPRDPKDVPEAIEVVRAVQERVPTFGICLGHQLFLLANGVSTYEMKFGRRNLNYPAREITTERIDSTSQSHGYAVDGAVIDPEKLLVIHVGVNDGTVEGIHHRGYSAFAMQHHPDAAPEPHDGLYSFDEFMELMDTWKGQS